MKLDGRRTSSNVDDRRGRSAGKIGGISLGGIIIAAIIYFTTGDLNKSLSSLSTQQVSSNTEQVAYQGTPEEEALATFTSQILAGTEDVWTKIFKENGLQYKAPKLVLFTGSVQSGCGGATASSGPFYCSADQTVYIDLSFFMTMKKQFGTAGDFAYAYVIAHEVGHHVQYLLGTLSDAHNEMSRSSKTESNKISVRLELQADFYAGVWAHNDNKMFGSLEEGDVDEGLAIAAKIGDDYLQEKAYGRSQPETFNHGTSAQRSRWLKKGIQCGDIKQGDTFSPAYNKL